MNQKYYLNQFYWIGSVYAHIHCMLDTSSKDLIKIIPIENDEDFETAFAQALKTANDLMAGRRIKFILRIIFAFLIVSWGEENIFAPQFL